MLVATIFCTATVLNVCKAPWSLHGLKRHSLSSADMITVTYWGTTSLMPGDDYGWPHSAMRQKIEIILQPNLTFDLRFDLDIDQVSKK